jgi:Tfp pilus assembly protein PilO
LKEYLNELKKLIDVIDLSDKEKLKAYGLLVSVAIVLVFVLAYYTNSIMNSLDNLSSLKHQQEYLQTEIKRLQNSNANLQKEYFELKNLEPEQ